MDCRPDPVIEHRLDPGTTATLDEWREVKDYLARSFAAYLGQEIEPVWEPLYEDIGPNWGFAFGIRSRHALGGPLAVEWYGVISRNGVGHTHAVVLLFAHDERAVHHSNRDYLYFEFVPTADGHREWQSRGWQSSEMDEWDGYLRLSRVCEKMGQRS